MPAGFVSFERKVLPLEHKQPFVTYPTADYWANSAVPLCRFEVIYGLGLNYWYNVSEVK